MFLNKYALVRSMPRKKVAAIMKKKKNGGFKTKKENRGKRFLALQVFILLLDK